MFFVEKHVTENDEVLLVAVFFFYSREVWFETTVMEHGKSIFEFSTNYLETWELNVLVERLMT